MRKEEINRMLLLLCLISTLTDSFSQEIENVHAEQQNNLVKITYDIFDAESNQQFNVKLFYSQYGYDWKQANKGLTGDIGLGVTSGFSKSITWNAIEDVDKLVGRGFIFKVKATMTGNNVNVKNEEGIDNNLFSGTSGSFTDSRDGKTYKWVKIDEQIWMAENVNFKTPTGSWCIDNDFNKCNKYGRLYNWEAANVACPNGWHLATDNEWTKLINYLGGKKVAGGKMKQAGSTNWSKNNTLSTNSSGFNALPSSVRVYDGGFHKLGIITKFWSSSEIDNETAWGWDLFSNHTRVDRNNYGKYYGFSVRCIKD